MWRLTPVNPYPGLFNVGWVKHGSPGNGALREPVQNSDTCSQGFHSATMGTWCPNPPFPGRFASRTLPLLAVGKVTIEAMEAAKPYRPAG